jgi:ribose transport system ATP-binding protein
MKAPGDAVPALPAQPGPAPVLTIRNVSKTFPGQRALADVSLDLHSGRTHALLGHNGSGKSTLIKILAGIHPPDSGAQVEVAGRPLPFGSPRDSRTLGLRFVHQDLGLVDELSAAENMALTWGYPRQLGLVRPRAHGRRVGAALERLGAQIDPDLPVGELRAVQRTAVAIARAVCDVDDDIAVLVLDEPTASLPPAEVSALFDIIAEVRSQGVGVLYVSHRLDEVLEIADDVSVLRDGGLVSSGPLGERGRDDLVRLILGVGDRVDASAHEARTDGAHQCGFSFEVSTDRLDDVRFTVAAGEIVGVAGLTGSGREELCAAIVGAVPSRSTVTDLERNAGPRKMTPAAARAMGVALVLSNRAPGAAVHEFNIRENISLPSLSTDSKAGFIRGGRERTRARTWIRNLAISPPDPEITFALLSGGNQQKTVMGRWLAIQPRILLLDDPTTGVDIGARNRIYALISEQARRGLPVLVVSSDTEDLTALCDRVVVLRYGRISAEVSGAAITEERLLQALSGGGSSRQSEAGGPSGGSGHGH